MSSYVNFWVVFQFVRGQTRHTHMKTRREKNNVVLRSAQNYEVVVRNMSSVEVRVCQQQTTYEVKVDGGKVYVKYTEDFTTCKWRQQSGFSDKALFLEHLSSLQAVLHGTPWKLSAGLSQILINANVTWSCSDVSKNLRWHVG